MNQLRKSSELGFISQIQGILAEFYKDHAKPESTLKPLDQHLTWLCAVKLLDAFQASKSVQPPFHFYLVGSQKDLYLIHAPGIDQAREIYLKEKTQGFNQPLLCDYTIEVIDFNQWVRIRELYVTDIRHYNPIT